MSEINSPSRFHFDFSESEGDYTLDEEGALFPDLGSARRATIEAMCSYAAEILPEDSIERISVRIRHGSIVVGQVTIRLDFK